MDLWGDAVFHGAESKNPENLYVTDAFQTFSTPNARATAFGVEKIPTLGVRQISRGPSTPRLAKYARRFAQDDNFVEGKECKALVRKVSNVIAVGRA